MIYIYIHIHLFVHKGIREYIGMCHCELAGFKIFTSYREAEADEGGLGGE